MECLILDQAGRTDPLQRYYIPSKKKSKPQESVKQEQHREKDVNNQKHFERRRGFHSFNDLMMVHEYSELDEYKYIFELSQ